jgi:hypothetical protein
MATEFTLGAEASCSDGPCGEVTRIVLDPATRTVTHLAIEPRHHPESGRLVPLEQVEAAGGEVRLGCTLADFDRFDPAREVELAEGLDYAGGYGPDAVAGYGDVGAMGMGPSSASGMSIGGSLGHTKPTVTSDAVPEGESDVARHERVHATDGDLGQLKGFAVDPADRVTHVLLREGHLWGRKEVAIPVRAVASFDDGVWLNITKKQVDELPPRS